MRTVIGLIATASVMNQHGRDLKWLVGEAFKVSPKIEELAGDKIELVLQVLAPNALYVLTNPQGVEPVVKRAVEVVDMILATVQEVAANPPAAAGTEGGSTEEESDEEEKPDTSLPVEKLLEAGVESRYVNVLKRNKLLTFQQVLRFDSENGADGGLAKLNGITEAARELVLVGINKANAPDEPKADEPKADANPPSAEGGSTEGNAPSE